ncbi:GSCOCG00003338001-RA-CDS [Cotesia congregata]|nr:GSCOCG00003338001-RA-CDS [Cotesia congregata]
MALNLFMDHANGFEDWNILDQDSLYFNERNVRNFEPSLQRMTQVKSGMNEFINNLTGQNLQDVIDEVSPWRYRILKNLFPSIKRRHSRLELRESELHGSQLRKSKLCNKFISSFWCWQLLTKPLDGYFYNMKIERKIINQGDNPVNIVCAAAEENYFAICTAETVFIYRIDNIKSPIYQTDFGLGSTNKSIHFYQNESGHLIAIVRLLNNRLRFIDVKYRKKLIYPAFETIDFNTICVGTHHKFFTERERIITEYELKSTTNTSNLNAVDAKTCKSFSKNPNCTIAYMSSENDKLFVVGEVGNMGYVVMTLTTPLSEQLQFDHIPIVRIDLMKNARDQIAGILVPVKNIIMSNADGLLKFGQWSDNERRMGNPVTLKRHTTYDNINKVTAYTIHANILFIGYENGFLQIFRINKKEGTTNLDDDESKSIKLSQDHQPITSICVSEFKDTLFIVATTARHFYPVKFIF